MSVPARGDGVGIYGRVGGSTDAFSLSVPYSYALQQFVRVSEATPLRAWTKQWIPGVKDAGVVQVSFWPVLGAASSPVIPAGEKLSDLRLSLAGGQSFGTTSAEASCAYVFALSHQARKSGGRAVGVYQIRFSGPTSPDFGPDWSAP